jgi:hypothetical protein
MATVALPRWVTRFLLVLLGFWVVHRSVLTIDRDNWTYVRCMAVLHPANRAGLLSRGLSAAHGAITPGTADKLPQDSSAEESDADARRQVLNLTFTGVANWWLGIAIPWGFAAGCMWSFDDSPLQIIVASHLPLVSKRSGVTRVGWR